MKIEFIVDKKVHLQKVHGLYQSLREQQKTRKHVHIIDAAQF
jgi:hypothetical protein